MKKREVKFDSNIAHVYIVRNEEQEKVHPSLKGAMVRATDFEGKKLGAGYVQSYWRTLNGTRMVSIRFVIGGILYSGKFNIDKTEFCKAKAIHDLNTERET